MQTNARVTGLTLGKPGAAIIATSSVTGILGNEGLPDYSSTKGAVNAFTKTLAMDLIKRGIVDSLGVQMLVDFCESRFQFRVADADLVPENFQTLRQLADYVGRKQAEAVPSGRRGFRRGR